MNNLLESNHAREIRKGLDKAIGVALKPFFPQSTRPLPRHEISDGLDGIDVELEWTDGRGEIARVFLLFRGHEYDITDVVRTNRDGSLTTLVKELFEEVAELRRVDEEEHDMSSATKDDAA